MQLFALLIAVVCGLAAAAPEAVAQIDFGVNSLEHRLDYPFAPGVVTDNTDIGTVTSNPVVVDSFPNSLAVSNTGLQGFSPTATTNRHFFLFATDDGQGSGPVARPFMEEEAWEMSVDVTIATTRADIRKSAGFGFEYFINPPNQDRRNPQFVAHTNQDGQGQLADPPGKVAAFSGVFGNNPFDLQYNATNNLATSDTVNFRIVYTPPERNTEGVVTTPANFDFFADNLDDQVAAEMQSGFQAEGNAVQGIPDGSVLGVRVQLWGNDDGAQANGGAGDDYAVLFENFTLIDPNKVLPGDYNNDGMVDAIDYAVWRENLGTSGPEGDGTGDDLLGVPDGDVDTFDYQFWAANFGATTGSGQLSAALSSSTPEPSTSLLVALLLGVASGTYTRRSPISGASVQRN